eukprot:2832073-Pyramimonas_sp.AAC.1
MPDSRVPVCLDSKAALGAAAHAWAQQFPGPVTCLNSRASSGADYTWGECTRRRPYERPFGPTPFSSPPA